ncbi:MAG: FtsH protease activity modulator HflK [bacterium]|nr:FtsH protease activity modulator HflK [bacterium]
MAQGDFSDQLNLPKFEPPQISGKMVRTVLVVVVLLLIALTSFYKVEPEEVGVILRFGAYVDETPPGLHYKLPFLIDRVFKVPVQRQLTEEFGYRSQQADLRGAAEEANMLTGDLNAAVVQWMVQYRISDPYKFLFRVRKVQDTFRDMSEAVMREVVGDRTVNEVLTVGREEITLAVIEELQELCDQYETGIIVDQVVLQDVTPPDKVKPAFNEVNQAEQERSTLINQAQSEYNKVVPRAEGEAQQTIREAEGYALDRVNRASGEATRFSALYDEYRKAPEVTRRRMYLETMNAIIPKTGRKVVVDDEIRGILPLLNLDTGTRRSAQSGGED